MIVSLQSHLQDPYLSVLQRENPDFDCRLDMTCMTCTLGATDTLPELATCFLTTIFSKSNAARYLRSALHFKK